MINRFLDTDGCVTVWPKKQSDKVLVLDYLATKFDANKTYTELEVNEILKLWHTFSDWPLLRRELVDRGYMQRDRSGYEYKLSCLVINIARHGQTDDNLAGIISYPQAKLTDKGVQQAIELARDVKEKGQDFDYIICSPIARAVATAEIIAQQLGGKKIYQDKRLVEGDVKKWEGWSIAELDRYFGPDKFDWHAYLD